MPRIQQLVYDGERLFCPDHPNQQLEEGITANGPFTVVCTAPIANSNHSCMNSAQWGSREQMIDELSRMTRNQN